MENKIPQEDKTKMTFEMAEPRLGFKAELGGESKGILLEPSKKRGVEVILRKPPVL